MKRIVITSALLAWGVAAGAQNLNPVVEVTNVYAREATGIEKPSQLLEMPDSVLRFNLDMDYTVQNTPYRGSYEFKPYLVQLRPQVRPSGEGKLYVRAGAGYSLHPEALVVWTPVRKESFRLNLFGEHNSYFGPYHKITLQGSEFLPDGTSESGSRMRTAAGADALFTWTGGALVADFQYKNIQGTNPFWAVDRSNHVLQGRLRVKSAPGSVLDYEAGTRVVFTGCAPFEELHTVSDGSLGTHFGVHRVNLGVSLETVGQTFQGERIGYAGNVALAPHYLLNTGAFHMNLGVKFSFLYRSENFCPHPSGIVFPDVRISFDAVQDVLVLYAAATGGDQIISYDYLLERNPFMGPFDGNVDNMVTRVNARIGGRGNVAERFHYDLKLGYKWDENAWTWGLVGGKPGIGYASPLHTFYVAMDAGWKSEKLDIGADVYYGYTKVPDLQGQTLFAPAPFRAQGHAFYNWGGRIQAGVTVEGRSKLPGTVTIPGYVDLGVQASLQMTRSLGFWIKGGNLLNQAIQRVPFYAEKGLYFTVGATFSL